MSKLRTILAWISIFLLLVSNWLCSAWAQEENQDYELRIEATAAELEVLQELKGYNKLHADRTTATAALEDYQEKLHLAGYLAASFDSLQADSNFLKTRLHLGKQYEWVELKMEGLEESVYQKAGFRSRSFQNKPIAFAQVLELQKSLLEHLENNGYPFANSRLQKIRFSESGISAILHTDKGRLLLLDTIKIRGNAKITKRFLQNYLDLQPGDPYNEAKLQRVANRIRELPYLEQQDPLQVDFIGPKARIDLSLKQKPSSRFDLVLGLLPRADNSGFDLTGDGELYLANPFGTGETIGLEYESYPQKSQEILVSFKLPYMPLVPIGLQFDFDLYRRDTIWSDTHYRLGFHYQIDGRNQLRAFYDRKKSVPNSLDTTNLNPNTNLPRIVGLQTNSYGLGMQFNSLDYRLNPRSGLLVDLSASLGNKTYPNLNILQDAGIVVPAEKNLQWRLNLLVEKFTPLGNAATLKTAWNAAGIIQKDDQNAELLFENELYRIGGNKIMRGFDEESINSIWYQLLTLEARYLLTRNSYAAIFTDISQLEQKEAEGKKRIWLYGFGPVLSFETKAGVFVLSYALGQQLGDPIDFRSGKVHFGYVNYF